MNWAYPLTMLIAIVAGGFLLRRNQQQMRLSGSQKLGLGVSAFVGSMLAAKVPFLFADWSDLSGGPIWLANGKTIMFGIVGGYLGVEVGKRIWEVRTKTGDSFAVPVAVSIAIGRVACFVGGCCFGKITTLPWGVHFKTVDGESMLLRHPTQLYETLFHFAMAGMLLFLYRKIYSGPAAEEVKEPSWIDLTFRTHLFKFYLLAYMIYRLLSEELRPEVEYWMGLTLYQWGAIAVIPLFAYLWFGELAMRGKNQPRVKHG